MQQITRATRATRARIACACAATALFAGCGENPGPLDVVSADPAFAAAARPEFETVSFDITFPDDGLCAFTVDTRLDVDLRIKRSTHPRTGMIIETTVFPNFRVTLSANGVTLSSRVAGANILQFDAQGNMITGSVVGLSAAFTVPGHGVVLLDAGKLIFENNLDGPPVWERGPHQQFGSNPDRTAICAALAG